VKTELEKLHAAEKAALEQLDATEKLHLNDCRVNDEMSGAKKRSD
jgi:hypothetical protein